jgi:hypothetical protein
MSAGSPLAAFFAIPPSQMRVQGSVQPPRKPQAVSQDMAVRIGVMMGAVYPATNPPSLLSSPSSPFSSSSPLSGLPLLAAAQREAIPGRNMMGAHPNRPPFLLVHPVVPSHPISPTTLILLLGRRRLAGQRKQPGWRRAIRCGGARPCLCPVDSQAQQASLPGEARAQAGGAADPWTISKRGRPKVSSDLAIPWIFSPSHASNMRRPCGVCMPSGSWVPHVWGL